MAIDWEEEAKEHLPTDGELKSVAVLVREMRIQNERTNEALAIAAREQEKLKHLVEHEVPEAMLAAGCSTFTTTDGVLVSIKEDVYASISKANQAKAYKWLEENGFSDVIKSAVSLTFGRGEHDRRDEAIDALVEAGYSDLSIKETVHGGTLKALVKEQLEAGNEIPEDLFGVHRVRQAKLS